MSLFVSPGGPRGVTTVRGLREDATAVPEIIRRTGLSKASDYRANGIAVNRCDWVHAWHFLRAWPKNLQTIGLV